MSFHTVRRGALVSVSIGAMACTSLFEMGCGATDSQGAQRAQGVGGATDSQGVGGLAFSSGSAGTCELLGATEACFDGNILQVNVGTCVPGQRKCLSSGEFGNWGPCIGAVNPSAEVCGDELDTNCDGVVDDGCVALACDGISPAFSNPYKDGSLRLTGNETAAFGPGTNEHSWICTNQASHIEICQDTTLVLKGGAPTVVGGLGIGPTQEKIVTIYVKLESAEPVWLRVDVTHAPVQFEFEVVGQENFPLPTVTLVIDGAFDVGVCPGIGPNLAYHHFVEHTIWVGGELPGGHCTHPAGSSGLGGVFGQAYNKGEKLPVAPPCP